jgi:predicted TIM-barrel fold metal-dependent hydrolase
MSLIDCDVHNVVGPIETLQPYLDEPWREVIATSQFAGPTDQAHPPNLATSLRADLAPVDGDAPGHTVAAMRAQLLDPLGTEVAILSCDYGVESVRNPDAAAALARAVNEWQVAEWLDREPRLRAAIVVPSQQPAAAVTEIEHWAADRRFVSVYLPVRSAIPYGNRIWRPRGDAIVRHQLVVEAQMSQRHGLAHHVVEGVDMASASPPS